MKLSTLLLLLFSLIAPVRAETFPAPPKLNEGPFPPFNQAEKEANPTSKAGLELYRTYLKNDSIANNDWITLAIRTEFSPTSEPKTHRYMLHKESIRLKDGWFIVSTLTNHPELFAQTISNSGELHFWYGIQGQTQKGIKVNCKDEIVQTPSLTMPWGTETPPLNYYLHSSGWFLTKHEIKTGKLVDLPGNSKEVGQIDRASLFNYVCEKNSSFYRY